MQKKDTFLSETWTGFLKIKTSLECSVIHTEMFYKTLKRNDNNLGKNLGFS